MRTSRIEQYIERQHHKKVFQSPYKLQISFMVVEIHSRSVYLLGIEF